jgi:hypothetical protein
MLHKIKRPSRAERLERIVKFQERVLEFVCDPQTPAAPDEQTIRKTFKEAEEWVWNKFKPDGPLREEMEQAIAYCHKNPGEREKILDAFRHDIDFHLKLDDPEFTFQYLALDAEAQQAMRPLMEAFYTDLLASGFPAGIHGEADSFNRDSFLEAFYEANDGVRVCPACDGPRPDTVKKKKKKKTYADADHFLPKSLYPFLSLHPANLVPICLPCNRTFKLDKDPIDDHESEPLVNTFHPYNRPAIDEIEIEVSRTDVGEQQIRIREKGVGETRRVRSLNRVFSLDARWVDRLKDAQSGLINAMSALRFSLQRKQESVDEAELRAIMTSMIDEGEKRFGNQSWQVLYPNYLRFVLSDDKDFKLLLESFNGQ